MDADVIDLLALVELIQSVHKCLDANGHLRGCEAGEGTDGNEDNCSQHCSDLRRSIRKVEERANHHGEE